MILYNKRITKELIRLRVFAGWSAPLLFANHRRQVFLRQRPYRSDSKKHTFYFFFVFFSVLKIYSPILPVFFLMIRFQMDLLPLGSTPLVGSSRMTALEPPTKAKATHSLRCIPPDSSLTLLFRQCQRLTSSRILKSVKKL